MSSIPLTLAEAVPLGTVLLQRLLDDRGIRSLVIKGPAFVELGVRRPKHSNDIDLLVAPEDRAAATEALARAGWSIISHWFPPALDDVIYSTTFHHPQFPATLDLHHHFSGLLATNSFEELWRRRTSVCVAHSQVVSVCQEHALIIEALNAIKKLRPHERRVAADRIVSVASPQDVRLVEAATVPLGARHTAAPLITSMGGSPPPGTPPTGYRRWVVHGARAGGVLLICEVLFRAPTRLPRVLWGQLTMSTDTAKLWATANGVTYRSRRQVTWLRMTRLFRRL